MFVIKHDYKLNGFLLLIAVLFNLRKNMATKDFLFSSLLNVCILCLCILTALKIVVYSSFIYYFHVINLHRPVAYVNFKKCLVLL